MQKAPQTGKKYQIQGVTKAIFSFIPVRLQADRSMPRGVVAAPGLAMTLAFGAQKISTAILFIRYVYTGEQRTFMGTLLLPSPDLE